MQTLEQWEIELRNQLGTPNKQSTNWEDQLINDLPKEITPKQKKKKTNLTLIMLIAIIFLGIATLFVFNHKTKFIENLTKQNTIKKEVEPNTETVELQQKIEELEEKQKELEKKLASQSDKISSTCNKITLLGVLFNENAVILKDNRDKQDLMTIDRGWQIKSMPKHLKLEESDTNFLKKQLK